MSQIWQLNTLLQSKKGHTMMHTYIFIHPQTNVPTKCQPSTPYGIQEIAQTRFYSQGHYGKVKGQIKVTPRCTPKPPNQCPY